MEICPYRTRLNVAVQLLLLLRQVRQCSTGHSTSGAFAQLLYTDFKLVNSFTTTIEKRGYFECVFLCFIVRCFRFLATGLQLNQYLVNDEM